MVKKSLVHLGEQQTLWADTSYSLLFRALFTADSDASARAMKPTLCMVYLCLYSSADYLSGCSDLSTRQIAQRIGITEKTANVSVHKLEQLGLVKIRKRTGKKTSVYQIINKIPLYRKNKDKENPQEELVGVLEWKHRPRETSDILQLARDSVSSNAMTEEHSRKGMSFAQVNIQVNITNNYNNCVVVNSSADTNIDQIRALPNFDGKETILALLEAQKNG